MEKSASHDPGLVDAFDLADALLRERLIADTLVRRLVDSHGERGWPLAQTFL
jgi:hypothetical protein